MSENAPLPVAGEGNVTTVTIGEQERLECDQKTVRTSDFYRTKNLPERFDRPDIIQGYNTKQEHPMYKTTTALYGSEAPTVHTVPTQFHGRSQKFTKNLGLFGMYRNHSLNTAPDTKRV